MENIGKIISLIKKTGDKALILDEKGEPKFVIMSVSAYEQLILGKSEVRGLTEDEFLDKINRDIEVWKDSQEGPNLPIEDIDFSQDLHEKGGFGQEYFNVGGNKGNIDENEENEDDDRYYFEPVE